MKILFITSTNLGDAILSTGLLGHLIDTYPGCKITVVCGAVPADLFRGVPQLDQLIVLKKKKYGLHWVQLWEKCWRVSWDMIVDLRGSAIAYFLSTKERYVWRSDGKKNMLKSTQIAQFMGLDTTPSNRVWLTNDQLYQAKKILPDGGIYIAFSPTSNWHKKNWPLQYFSALAYRILRDKKIFPQAKFIILGASFQRGELTPLLCSLPASDTIDLVGKIDLPIVAACLKRCRIFVGNDSGLMHLSATVGTPTLGLFGPSNSTVYGPYGPRTMILEAPLSLQERMEQAKHGQDVMGHILPEEVFKKMKGVLT